MRTVRRLRATAVAGAALAIATACAGAVAAPGVKTVTIKVNAKDFSFALSRRSAPAGTTVRFVVRNRGSVPHDFVVAKKRTRLLARGGTQTITVVFGKQGRYAFLCSVPGHAKLGMKGTFAAGKPPAPAPKPPPPTVDPASLVRLTKIGDFDRPVHVAAPPGDPRRLFVVEQRGVIRVVADGATLTQPFLDITDRVIAVSETGLLSMAFAPDWATSGLAYVFYNERRGNGDIVVAEVPATRTNPNVADVAASRRVLEIVKPWENHNGGMLQFGPDEMLYVSVGDGDSGVYNRPGAFAQRLDDLLGNILRIDPRGRIPYAVPVDNPFVNAPGARPEVWAFGLRNPWRFWIDHLTGVTLVGDVGAGAWEEIDLIPAGAKGLNFGWPCLEGSEPFDREASCLFPTGPLVEVSHATGACAITAGVVVRDTRLPGLAGRFLYGDYCTGRVVAAAIVGRRVADSDDLGVTVPELASFGVDGLGRVYLVSTAGGVFRLDPASEG